MKKSFIYGIFLTALLVLPGNTLAQTSSLGSFDIIDGQASATPSPQQGTLEDEATFLEVLKNKPLSERRKIVARELETIAIKIDSLLQKTAVATARLAENNIDTSTSLATLAGASKTLETTKSLIATLITVSEDPANESVQNLMVGTLTFKEVVIQAEEGLRSTRGQIISALGSLKSAVQASVMSQ